MTCPAWFENSQESLSQYTHMTMEKDSDQFAVAILSHITRSRHEPVKPGYHV